MAISFCLEILLFLVRPGQFAPFKTRDHQPLPPPPLPPPPPHPPPYPPIRRHRRRRAPPGPWPPFVPRPILFFFCYTMLRSPFPSVPFPPPFLRIIASQPSNATHGVSADQLLFLGTLPIHTRRAIPYYIHVTHSISHRGVGGKRQGGFSSSSSFLVVLFLFVVLNLVLLQCCAPPRCNFFSSLSFLFLKLQSYAV
ncbi:hypothetical protein B0O80DRAFT_136482 [Mortierella sp. GBAus27b]|nr:hypothetical protein B0O80DRAFT_136482 [Mortierella sp. GBAus27b]